MEKNNINKSISKFVKLNHNLKLEIFNFLTFETFILQIYRINKNSLLRFKIINL